MKVFLYETQNDVPVFFQREDFQVPFLHTNLLTFMGAGFMRNAISLGEEAQVFLPSSWEDSLPTPHNYSFYSGELSKTLESHQKREYELVFLTNLFSLMVGDFLPQDVAHLKQNPEKLFSNGGVIGGYLRRGQEMPKPEEFVGFDNILTLTFDNFLGLNQQLVGNLNIKSVEVGCKVYGKPVILSENVSDNSTVCYPSYIDKDVVVRNSYIGPGTVLRGDSVIEDSKLYGSFVESSRVISSELHDTIATSSYVESANLGRNTLLPPGSMINSERKV